MNYREFRSMVKESYPGIPINDKYIRSGMRGAYERIPHKRGLDKTQAGVYAQIFADGLLAGRNSVSVPSMEVIGGLAKRLFQADSIVVGLRTQPATPATRNPARPPVVA